MSTERLYTVIPTLQRPARRELPPRFDLAPMNHTAACNFMQACTNEFTHYHLIDWPDEVPHPKPPIHATGYREGAEPPVKETPAYP